MFLDNSIIIENVLFSLTERQIPIYRAAFRCTFSRSYLNSAPFGRSFAKNPSLSTWILSFVGVPENPQDFRGGVCVRVYAATNERCYGLCRKRCRGVASNEVVLRTNDVMLRINDVSLRENITPHRDSCTPSHIAKTDLIFRSNRFIYWLFYYSYGLKYSLPTRYENLPI